jgi:hypothetical protein
MWNALGGFGPKIDPRVVFAAARTIGLPRFSIKLRAPGA